ncbi:MAG: AmmeMemoRadiSam system radical SAM enzyme [Coriobacteriales bacterium]|nr:AmmeMemoRadiSam system radical SAM enzyme [Coriobacteriales bacterium]
MSDELVCDVCPRACKLKPQATGFCGARVNNGDTIVCDNYGRVTSIALDPVTKKPLARWNPQDYVVSLGSYGCNMSCPFCQNYQISAARQDSVSWEYWDPQQVVQTTLDLRKKDPRVIGIAFTYNEPLISWEYVRDTSLLAHKAGLKNVLVSNGQANAHIIQGLLGLIDAVNIDLKASSQEVYSKMGGSLETAQTTISLLAQDPACHVEVTTLMVPGMSAGLKSIAAIAQWIANIDPEIPYHLSRCFPRYKMTDIEPTPVADVYKAAELARTYLHHVYTGNC